MKRFEVTVLGCKAAFPSADQITSSFVVHYEDQCLIIDCGEGMQMKIQEYGVKLTKLNAILISHLHGDHVYGLPGLLTSLSSHNRTEPLAVIGPLGIKEFVEQMLSSSYAFLSYKIDYIELSVTTKSFVWEDNKLTIHAFPLIHRVPTYGYILAEKTGLKNLDPANISAHNLTIPEIKSAKLGHDIYRPNGVILNGSLVFPADPVRQFAYVSDTQYDESLATHLAHVSTIYHEATYLDVLKEKALQYMHSTALQAAQVALDSRAKALYLGHVSTRYENPELLATEAQTIFAATEVVYGGTKFEIV